MENNRFGGGGLAGLDPVRLRRDDGCRRYYDGATLGPGRERGAALDACPTGCSSECVDDGIGRGQSTGRPY